ncbi:hypothetical protein [Bradyrhizobium sp. Arg816]|uniref:hypothetical protein n=1 Tax=Bradyrhizobium sp. Arg816 TaxID=2998491 RepID=UPI00249EB567|nr:hypothetical protein [Bradyrhizobium sp. Arg816]MDI3564600.1 hypothetical protein [Bradyrhizobium sp. Arg816]
MAVNKPTGDNARKGAVKKRSQIDNRRRYRRYQTRQDVRRVHGCEEAENSEESRDKIQRRAGRKES